MPARDSDFLEPPRPYSMPPEAFRWETSKSNPEVQQRRAIGIEAVVGPRQRNYRGENDPWLIKRLSVFDTPAAAKLSLSLLKTKLEAVLLELRFQHPDLGCTPRWDEQVIPLIQYTPPKSNEEAIAWAKNAVHVHPTPLTAHELRVEMETNRKVIEKKPADSIAVHVIADVADDKAPFAPGSTVWFMMHMNHLYWDGIGCVMFGGDLLRGLGKNLSIEPTLEFNWGEETKRLPVPILDTLRYGMEDAGESFYKGCEDWGLQPKPENKIPSVAFHNFTVAESKAMINAVKTHLSPKHTITHLGQAATILALLKANPPPEALGNLDFIQPLTLNGRRWVRPEHVRSYGVCQTGGITTFKDLRSYMVDENDKDAVFEALKRGTDLAKQYYDKFLNEPYQLPIGLSVQQTNASTFLASDLDRSQGMTVPVFISDGVFDVLADGEVVDAVSGQNVLSVDNIGLFFNQHQPAIVVRLNSWKNESQLTICYNDGSFPTLEAVAFGKDIAKYMLAFAQ
ncbi:trichothecene 15-O-acetyltransferase [Aspergillus hancockii]|nr:trichothecene 15-O-acetyltransferase [Aspergillus hancockii]